MAAILVTLDQGKGHLGIPLTTTDRDAAVQLMLDEAEAVILQRCSSTAHWAAIVPTWTAGTAPAGVRAAILLLLANFDANRGDDESFGVGGQSDGLWASIDRLLALNKDPVIA